MRILYINSIQYDYTTATLIEGLTELGHEIRSSAASNYGKAIPEGEFVAFAESADLIVVGSNRGAAYHLLENVGNQRIVAVDGNDQASIWEVPGFIRVKAIFKRELCRAEKDTEANRIYPFPFAAEKRYFVAPVAKDVLVSFVATMHTNPLRHSVHVRLGNRKHQAILSGWTNERSYSIAEPQANAIETPGYRQFLARSRISVNVPGAGYDCARYWEILAARAMLLTWTPDIMIPDEFTDGLNCVTFSSLDEFDQKLDHYLAHPERVAEIAEAGYQHLLAFHTTARRASYFLDMALPAVSRPDFCDRVYTGPK